MLGLLGRRQRVLRHDWFQIGYALYDSQDQDMQKLSHLWLSHFFITKHCDLCVSRGENGFRHPAVIAITAVLQMVDRRWRRIQCHGKIKIVGNLQIVERCFRCQMMGKGQLNGM